MRWFLGSIALLLLIALVVFRIWPVTPADFHVQAEERTRGAYPSAGAYVEVRAVTAAPEVFLARVGEIAQSTPRTRLIAGSIEERMLTYETRSRIFGFPDYTTVSIIPEAGRIGDLVQIHARLRFGQSDLGVNQARVIDWLDQLGPLTVRP